MEIKLNNGRFMNITKILNLWASFFNAKNLDGILDTYASNGVLLATFNKDILQGRDNIRPYFIDLFKKENLRVIFEPNCIVTHLEEGYVISGNYTFSFTENGVLNQEDARYSYVVEMRGNQFKIVNHHSSVRPK
jgi:hypothetical protein